MHLNTITCFTDQPWEWSKVDPPAKNFYFYKIKNNVDDYCYIGTTSNPVKHRICDHLWKSYKFWNNRFYEPFWYEENAEKRKCLFEETLYGEGPFNTKLSCMGAAINLYGWENFTVELLAAGKMTRRTAYTLENEFIENEPKNYNQIYNSYIESSSISSIKKDWKYYTPYKNTKINMFNIEDLNYGEAEDKTCEILDSYFENLIC